MLNALAYNTVQFAALLLGIGITAHIRCLLCSQHAWHDVFGNLLTSTTVVRAKFPELCNHFRAQYLSDQLVQDPGCSAAVLEGAALPNSLHNLQQSDWRCGQKCRA